jgi:hypothetical protein
MDIRVSRTSDAHAFRAVASALQAELGGAWTARLDEPQHCSWDLLVQPDVVTLHLDHGSGIFLGSRAEVPRAFLERAAAAVPEREDWTFRTTLSAPFVARSDGEAGSLAHDLTEDDTHIHAALELLARGRALPRLGFWGAHDVCLNTWLEELRRAVRHLDAGNDATFEFDEGEQGQPLYRFRRSSTSLFLSVEDSLVSGASGEPDWKDVPCEYEDFRFQVFRLFGVVRGLLERELGAGRANEWLRAVEEAVP